MNYSNNNNVIIIRGPWKPWEIKKTHTHIHTHIYGTYGLLSTTPPPPHPLDISIKKHTHIHGCAYVYFSSSLGIMIHGNTNLVLRWFFFPCSLPPPRTTVVTSSGWNCPAGFHSVIVMQEQNQGQGARVDQYINYSPQSHNIRDAIKRYIIR